MCFVNLIYVNPVVLERGGGSRILKFFEAPWEFPQHGILKNNGDDRLITNYSRRTIHKRSYHWTFETNEWIYRRTDKRIHERTHTKTKDPLLRVHRKRVWGRGIGKKEVREEVGHRQSTLHFNFTRVLRLHFKRYCHSLYSHKITSLKVSLTVSTQTNWK